MQSFARTMALTIVLVTTLAACSTNSISNSTEQLPQTLELGDSIQAVVQQAGHTPEASLVPSYNPPENYYALAQQALSLELPQNLQSPLFIAFKQAPEQTRLMDISLWYQGEKYYQDYQLFNQPDEANAGEVDADGADAQPSAEANVVVIDRAWFLQARSSELQLQQLSPAALELRVQLLAYDALTTQFLFSSKKPNNSAYGILHVPANTYDQKQACQGKTQVLPSAVSLAAANAPIPEGKTAVLLLHGWQVLGQMIELSSKKQYTPGFCSWVALINQIASDSDSSMRDQYEFFSFDYDSYLRVAHNADKLHEEVARVFGNRPVILMGHSMGGMVANTYVQSYPDNVQQLISLGTPYRGTTALACTKNHNGFCSAAKPNPEIPLASFLSFLHILDKVLAYDGSLDLAWEYSGYETGTSYRWCGWRLCSKKNYSVGNAFLQRINQQDASAFQQHTAITLTIATDGSDTGSPLYRILEKAIARDTGHQNDMIVPVGSACLGTGLGAAPDRNPCANRLIQQRYHFESNHLDIKERYDYIKQVFANLVQP